MIECECNVVGRSSLNRTLVARVHCCKVSLFEKFLIFGRSLINETTISPLEYRFMMNSRLSTTMQFTLPAEFDWHILFRRQHHRRERTNDCRRSRHRRCFDTRDHWQSNTRWRMFCHSQSSVPETKRLASVNWPCECRHRQCDIPDQD